MDGTASTGSSPSVGEPMDRVGMLDDIPRLGSRVVRNPRSATSPSSAPPMTASSRCTTAARTKQGKLSQGIVHGTSVTCPLHNWVIGLDDGSAKDPDEGCVRTVPVRLDGD